ncbi:MAG: helix-turn-helix transcriptional regulator [Bryobacteraceae bacterium]|nr:helix-turn-helix transcriptional regulator [Bryobacteraceae bacterium]
MVGEVQLWLVPARRLHAGSPVIGYYQRFCSSKNSRHLRRLFRHEVGTTFRAYLRVVRLRHAATLLARGHGTVGEIAAMLGYMNVSDFIREFRHYFGRTPANIGAPKACIEPPTRASRTQKIPIPFSVRLAGIQLCFFVLFFRIVPRMVFPQLLAPVLRRLHSERTN